MYGNHHDNVISDERLRNTTTSTPGMEKLSLRSEDAAAFNSGHFRRTGDLIVDDFPRKILRFDELLRSEQFSAAVLSSPLQDGVEDVRATQPATSSAEETVQLQQQEPSSTADRRLDNVLRNPHRALQEQMRSMTAQVKSHLVELRDDIHDVQLWIRLLTPRISDGNNAGVDIQTKVKDDVVHEAEDVAKRYLEKMDSYYKQHATLAGACVRNPNVEDYGRALNDLNCRQFICMREAVIQLRNQYAAMYHFITKNWRMITQPR